MLSSREFPRVGRKAVLGAFMAGMIALVACSSTESATPAPAAPTPNVQATIAALPTSTPIIQVETVEVVVTPTPVPAQPTSTPLTTIVVATPTMVTQPDIKIASASATLAPNNNLIVMVDVNLTSSGKAFVEYTSSGTASLRTPITDSDALSHEIPLFRMRADETYSYTAYAIDADGNEVAGVSGTITTGALPPELAKISITATGTPTFDVAFMDWRDRGQPYLIALDEESEIVWYYTVPEIDQGVNPAGLNGIKQKPNGNIVYYAGNPSNPCCIREITPLGVQVDELTAGSINGAPHHDFLILDDHTIMYTADKQVTVDDSPQSGHANQLVTSDSVRIWDQTSGKTREVWDALDYWDPADPNQREQWDPDPDDPTDDVRWIHFNSITMGPTGNIVLSSRNRNQVISLSPDYSEIEWQISLDNSGSPPSSFEWENPEDRFYRSHTASQLSNGNILVFDNGATRPVDEGGQYSRALELRVDGYDLVVRKVWEYRNDPDVYARNVSSAWRLDNGNTLVNWGNRDDLSTQPVVVAEVNRDGEELWELEMQSDTLALRFRVYAFDNLFGETVVE